MEGRNIAFQLIQVIRKKAEWSMDSNHRMNGDLLKVALENPVLWAGMKGASAGGRKK
jgi:hypothetical protein